MEKYDAIFRTINDKIAEQEDVIKMYRKTTAEKDATIRELKAKVSDLELALYDETQKNNELTSGYKNLKAYNDALYEANTDLKKTIEALNKKINEFENF